jgi:type III secretion protein J
MKRIISLIFLCCLLSLLTTLAACDRRGTALLNGLPEEEANTIVAALAQSNIAASKTVIDNGTASIYVAGTNQSAALSELHQRGLPRQNYSSLGDIFKKDGIISTPLEEQARYIYALAQELEKTLSQLDDVVYVRVHPVLARKASLNGPAANASAGVLIKHRPDVDLTFLIPQIQELVAHSIPDLRSDQVAIIMAVSEDRRPINEAADRTTATQSIGLGWWLALAGVILGLLIAGAVYAIRRNEFNPMNYHFGTKAEVIELHE